MCFFTDSVHYLGFVLDKHGVHPNSDKIEAFLDVPTPCDVKQLQSFLGLCIYYSRFIPNYAFTMSPLYFLLQNNSLLFGNLKKINVFTLLSNFLPQQCIASVQSNS